MLWQADPRAQAGLFMKNSSILDRPKAAAHLGVVDGKVGGKGAGQVFGVQVHALEARKKNPRTVEVILSTIRAFAKSRR